MKGYKFKKFNSSFYFADEDDKDYAPPLDDEQQSQIADVIETVRPKFKTKKKDDAPPVEPKEKEEEEEEEIEEKPIPAELPPDDDGTVDLATLGREELEAVITDNKLEVEVTKEMSDEEVRKAILGTAVDEDEEVNPLEALQNLIMGDDEPPPVVEPKDKPPVEPPEVDIEEFLTEEDFEGVFEDRKKFNKLLSQVYAKAKDDARKEAADELRPVLQGQVKKTVSAGMTVERFWNKNQDLAPISKLVSAAASKVQAANPKMSLGQVYDTAGKEVRKALAQVQKEKKPKKKDGAQNFAQPVKGRKTTTVKRTSKEVGGEISQLIKFNEGEK